MPGTIANAVKCLKVLWASPYTLLGLLVGTTSTLTGGSWRISCGAIEFYGGFAAWFVRHLPTGAQTMGFTLGHVIVGQTLEGLDRVSEHERVHVRQYEKWGPLMGPFYLLASAWLWIIGRDPYRDNPFEVEAYREAP